MKPSTTITTYYDPDPADDFNEHSFRLAKDIEAANGVIVPSGSSHITPDQVVAVVKRIRKHAPNAKIIGSHLDPMQILHPSLRQALDGVELVYFHNGPPELNGLLQSKLYPKLVSLWGKDRVKRVLAVVTAPNVSCYKAYGGRPIDQQGTVNAFNFYLTHSTFDSYTLITGDERNDIPVDLIEAVVSIFDSHDAIQKLTVFAGVNSIEKADKIKKLGVKNIGIDNVIQQDPFTAKEIISCLTGLISVPTK